MQCATPCAMRCTVWCTVWCTVRGTHLRRHAGELFEHRGQPPPALQGRGRVRYTVLQGALHTRHVVRYRVRYRVECTGCIAEGAGDRTDRPRPRAQRLRSAARPAARPAAQPAARPAAGRRSQGSEGSRGQSTPPPLPPSDAVAASRAAAAAAAATSCNFSSSTASSSHLRVLPTTRTLTTPTPRLEQVSWWHARLAPQLRQQERFHRRRACRLLRLPRRGGLGPATVRM